MMVLVGSVMVFDCHGDGSGLNHPGSCGNIDDFGGNVGSIHVNGGAIDVEIVAGLCGNVIGISAIM